jgi:hypothetical protein
MWSGALNLGCSYSDLIACNFRITSGTTYAKRYASCTNTSVPSAPTPKYIVLDTAVVGAVEASACSLSEDGGYQLYTKASAPSEIYAATDWTTFSKVATNGTGTVNCIHNITGTKFLASSSTNLGGLIKCNVPTDTWQTLIANRGQCFVASNYDGSRIIVAETNNVDPNHYRVYDVPVTYGLNKGALFCIEGTAKFMNSAGTIANILGV